MAPSDIHYSKWFKDFSGLKAYAEHSQFLGDIQVVVSNCDWSCMAFMVIFHFLIGDQEKRKPGFGTSKSRFSYRQYMTKT